MNNLDQIADAINTAAKATENLSIPATRANTSLVSVIYRALDVAAQRVRAETEAAEKVKVETGTEEESGGEL